MIHQPSSQEDDDLLLSCRFGDLEDIKHFVVKFGQEPLSDLRDHNGNTVLHLSSANGHIGEPCSFSSNISR
jgi:ankyrin repeat protein